MNLTKTANIQYTKSAPAKSGVRIGVRFTESDISTLPIDNGVFFVDDISRLSQSDCAFMMGCIGVSQDTPFLSGGTPIQCNSSPIRLASFGDDDLIINRKSFIMSNQSIATPVAIKNISFENIQVSFTHDAYLNATQIAQAFGKAVKDYLKTERTQEYITALAEAVNTASQSDGKKILSQNDLVIIKKGNSKNFKQGTWLHPKLAIDFARWLNPKFAVWCDMQIEKILKGESTTEQKTFTAEVFHDLAYQNYMTSVLVAHVENHIVPFLESIRSKDLSFYTVLLEELKAQTQQNCTQLYKNMPEAYHEHKSKRLPFTTYKYLQLAHGFHDDKGYGTHFYPILRNNSVYCSV